MPKWINPIHKSFRVFDKKDKDFDIRYGKYQEGNNTFGDKEYFGVRWLKTQDPRNKHGFPKYEGENGSEAAWVLLPKEIVELMMECYKNGEPVCED